MLRSSLRQAVRMHARGLKVTANTLKTGNLVSGSAVGSSADRILKVDDIRPGKKGGQGAGFIEAKFKDFQTGQTLQHKFRPNEDVEMVELDHPVAYQFLYQSDDGLHLMDMETFDEVELPASLLGDQLPWLVDGMEVKVRKLKGAPLTAALPDRVEFEVVEAGASGKKGKSGDTHKTVTLSNGAALRVPHFIDVGDTVVVQTQDGTYHSKL